MNDNKTKSTKDTIDNIITNTNKQEDSSLNNRGTKKVSINNDINDLNDFLESK